MTIYLEIVRQCLIDIVTETRDKAIAADRGVVNYLASWVGLERNPVVSKGKQNLADDLLAELKSFKDRNNDLETAVALKTLIKKYKADAAVISSAKGYDEGAFGPDMIKAKGMTKGLYKQLESVGMLNIPRDDDPLNIYRFHMAQYFLNKLLKASRAPTFIELIIANPNITSSYQVSEKKKKSILKNLTTCEAKLVEYDHPASRRDWVLVYIGNLSRKNEGVCNDHTITSKASVSFSIFSKLSISTPTIGPGVGFLHDCLVAAFKEVRSTPLRKVIAVAKDPEPVPKVETEEDFTEIDLTETDKRSLQM